MELNEKVDGLEKTIVEVKTKFNEFKSDVVRTLSELKDLIASKDHEISTLQGKIEALEKNFAEEDEVNAEVETQTEESTPAEPEAPAEPEQSTDAESKDEDQEKENEPTA
jgi:peptidoglycan hydrolase CwlO-like protein